MPDISMCSDAVCPKRKQCYRFVATPTPGHQAYADFKFSKRHGCEYFWPFKKQGGADERKPAKSPR